MSEEGKADTNPQPHGKSRREFLRIAAVLSAILAVGGIGAVSKSVTQQAGNTNASPTIFPKVKVSNLSQLQANTPVIFSYPLDNEPNILVKLGEQATGGVGPGKDIVAFSQICQHVGCPYAFLAKGTSPTCDKSYVANGPVGYCCCHGTIYDYTNGARVIGGPAPRPVPQVILVVESNGDIYATGMNPPTIFGHNTGSSDVTADLQGGTVVS